MCQKNRNGGERDFLGKTAHTVCYSVMVKGTETKVSFNVLMTFDFFIMIIMNMIIRIIR